jgi:hypothetical protein
MKILKGLRGPWPIEGMTSVADGAFGRIHGRVFYILVRV